MSDKVKLTVDLKKHTFNLEMPSDKAELITTHVLNLISAFAKHCQQDYSDSHNIELDINPNAIEQKENNHANKTNKIKQLTPEQKTQKKKIYGQ